MRFISPGRPRGWLRSPTGVALCVFLAIALFFLLTEHRAHAFGVLPYLLILLCPLLHLFHHGRHGGHRVGEGSRDQEPAPGEAGGRRAQ